MAKIMENNKNLTIFIDEKYFKNVIANPMDDFFISSINYLKSKEKHCAFLGFNRFNGHVILIDGIKYCTKGTNVYGDWGTNHKAEFFLVEDLDYDYNENRFKDRVNEIVSLLDKRI